jgi:hypothetical protein
MFALDRSVKMQEIASFAEYSRQARRRRTPVWIDDKIGPANLGSGRTANPGVPAFPSSQDTCQTEFRGQTTSCA